MKKLKKNFRSKKQTVRMMGSCNCVCVPQNEQIDPIRQASGYMHVWQGNLLFVN